MTEVFRKINVDLSRKTNSRLIFARENDKGSRNILIKVLDDGVPYKVAPGATAIMSFKAPDDLRGSISIIYQSDGYFLARLQPIMLRTPGVVSCSVSIFDADENRVTSSDFYLEVLEEFYVGTLINAVPESVLLDTIFAQLSGYSLAEDARVDAENKRATAEDERKKAEKEREEAEKLREQADTLREQRIIDAMGVSGSFVLYSGNWSDTIEQYFLLKDIRESDLILFYPLSLEDRDMIGICDVFVCPDVQNQTIKASAKIKPSRNITLRYFIIRGRAAGEEV